MTSPKQIIIGLTALSILGLSACGESAPRIDTTTEETTQASIDKMMAEMSAEEQTEFQAAVTAAIFFPDGEDCSPMSFLETLAETDEDQIEELTRKALHGKTVDQIMKAYEVNECAEALKDLMATVQ